MTQLNYQPPTGPTGFPDRSGRLIAAGILFLLSAAGFGCFTASTPLALVAAQVSPGAVQVPVSQIVSTVVIYLALTVLFGFVGIGAVIKRRWSRPLGLIVATHWLLIGIVSLGMSVVMIPVMKDSFAAGAAPPAGAMTWFLVFMFSFAVILGVGWPAAMLSLLRGEAVQRTLEYYDAVPRWTDRLPIRVLGLALTLVVLGLVWLLGFGYGIYPLFGVYLTGPAAYVALAMSAAVCLLAGHWVFRLRMAGWHLAFWGNVLLTISATVTGIIGSPMDIYDAMGTRPEEIEVLQKSQHLLKPAYIAMPLLIGVTFAVYLLRLKKPMQTAAAELVSPALPS